jgi:hypothetical protein
VSTLSTFATEWELHEPEWEQPESQEWEWEASGEAEPFLDFLRPLAAQALPAIEKAVLPAIRQLLPAAAQAIGSTVNSILPSSGSAAGSGGFKPAIAPPRPSVARPQAPIGAHAGRQRALGLIRELHGLVLRGEAEAEAAESALFGSGQGEFETGHPNADEAALTEVLGAEAAHTASEAEAEALLGAALPITIRIISGRRSLRHVTPALVQANSRLVRGLRRSGPAGPHLLRLVPKIQRNTVATLKHQQRNGRPVSPSKVAPVMAAHAVRVLGTPHKSGPALVRNAMVRQRTVAPATGRRIHNSY